MNRWEAGQTLSRALLLQLAGAAQRGEALELPALFVEAFRAVVTDAGLDGSMRQLMLALPTEHELAERVEVVDPDALFQAASSCARAWGARSAPSSRPCSSAPAPAPTPWSPLRSTAGVSTTRRWRTSAPRCRDSRGRRSSSMLPTT